MGTYADIFFWNALDTTAQYASGAHQNCAIPCHPQINPQARMTLKHSIYGTLEFDDKDEDEL